MKKKNCCLITEAFGFGIMAIPMAAATKTNPVAYSLKSSKEDFEKEVELISNNLAGIAERFNLKIEKASFEEKDELLANGWMPVEDFKKGTLPEGIWSKWAEAIHWTFVMKEKPRWQATHPQLEMLAAGGKKILAVNLQKWVTASEIEADKQSLESSAAKALAETNAIKVFTSHFSKVNDLEKVAEMRALLQGMYVPGETEANHLFGVRGVKHAEFIPLVFAADASLSIASTWQWLAMVIKPSLKQRIFCNCALPDARYAKEIERSFAALGYSHQYTVFDEETDVATIEKEVRSFLVQNELL